MNNCIQTNTIILNKKKYTNTGCFVKQHIQEYCNLDIYPLVGIIEREIAILRECGKYLGKESHFFHYCDNNEIDEFFQDCVVNATTEHISACKISRIDDSYRGSLGFVNGQVIIGPKSRVLKERYPNNCSLHNNRFIYFSKNNTESIPKNIHTFNNLVKYTMIVKNAGPLLEQVLKENIPFMDSWCILDTGSTDDTVEIISKTLQSIPGKLYQEPFINFRDSRNRCLELAGTDCKFVLMLDDTYVIREPTPGSFREFLNITRGDQFADSFSLLIQSHDTEYYSNRITKSANQLRYIYTIHEVIQEHDNINVTIPKEVATIFDYRSDYMEKRTMDRKQFDLDLLFKEYELNPDDPRALYYIAQTYGCIGDEINKAKYFEKRIQHPVQGYIQEKIDALFELARTYNFKLNKPWDVVEPLYMQAWELDKNRPDSVYFIGIHWYLEKDYSLAYKYFKLAYSIGYPVNSQYSLKPTLTFHYTPKFLTEVCFYQRDYPLGLEAARFYIENNPKEPNYQVNQWYNIHTHCSKVLINNQVNTNNQLFVIVADGGWKPWSGKDITSLGVGGSETWVIETARNIPKHYTTIVFCKTQSLEIFEDVEYHPIEEYESFLSNNTIEIVVISRYTQYIPCTLMNSTIKRVGVIFHDTFMNETIIPIDPRLTFFCLTDFHKSLFVEMFPQFNSNVNVLNYGITQAESNFTKIKHSFIYSSFPNRGLLKVLELWPMILERMPDATINIFCDLDHQWSNQHYPDYLNAVKSLINQKGITNHGWVSKAILREYWAQSEYWLYPCNFVETFCMTALEAAYYKVKVVSNNLGSLAETVGDRGVVIGDDWTDNDIVDSLFENFDDRIIRNYSWARGLTWKGQTELMMKYLINFSAENPIETQAQLEYFDMLNWTVDCPTGSKEPFVSVLQQLPIDGSILEIGTFVGTSVIGMLETVPMATATVIDPWIDYRETVGEFKSPTENMDSTKKIFHKNIALRNMTGRITVIEKSSIDGLLQLITAGILFDFIYIDGSHRCMDVFLDAELAWRLLKPGGIMGFDDLHFNQSIVLESPWEAIQYFIGKYSKSIKVISQGYRLFIEKL
jgi:glycosyltransferase involved in cell wall biosynthesis